MRFTADQSSVHIGRRSCILADLPFNSQLYLMRAIEIQRNGGVICLAGAPQALMLAVELSADVEGTTAALSVHGMAELGGECKSHLWWFNHLEIIDGDELRFRLIETDTVTLPLEDTASDSPEFIAEQQKYEEDLKANPLQPREMVHNSNNLSFQVRAKNVAVEALLDAPREFLTARLLWTNFGGERFRISVSSFSQIEALERKGGRDWLNEKLILGDECAVKVSYNSSLQTGAPPVRR